MTSASANLPRDMPITCQLRNGVHRNYLLSLATHPVVEQPQLSEWAAWRLHIRHPDAAAAPCAAARHPRVRPALRRWIDAGDSGCQQAFQARLLPRRHPCCCCDLRVPHDVMNCLLSATRCQSNALLTSICHVKACQGGH